jgi:hypothetical protein
MIENKTTEERPTNLGETFKAAATPAADPSTPDKPTDEAMELDDEQAQAISGGNVQKKHVAN